MAREIYYSQVFSCKGADALLGKNEMVNVSLSTFEDGTRELGCPNLDRMTRECLAARVDTEVLDGSTEMPVTNDIEEQMADAVGDFGSSLACVHLNPVRSVFEN